MTITLALVPRANYVDRKAVIGAVYTKARPVTEQTLPLACRGCGGIRRFGSGTGTNRMNGGFEFLDIILFAMVAAFILLRLRGVLGRRTGHERRPTNPFTRRDVQPGSENVVHLREPGDRDDVAADDLSDVGDSTLAEGLLRIKQADPNFTRASFLEGSQAAFEVVVGAYAAGDTEALRPILADDVYRRFARAIRDRADARRSLETTVVSDDGSEIIEAGMNGRTAIVTVRFTTHQINVTRDADENVVDGDPRDAVEVVDIWTFERNTRSRDPIWNLVATRIPN